MHGLLSEFERFVPTGREAARVATIAFMNAGPALGDLPASEHGPRAPGRPACLRRRVARAPATASSCVRPPTGERTAI
ncbi:hypothetical protein MMR14E_18400 [Methylobacterium mesophilicum]